MITKEQSLNGGYSPSFYHIEIDTEKSITDIDINELSPTVIHEYIHFFQDMFTTFGLARSSTAYNKIAYLYNYNQDCISLPINIDELFGKDHCASINEHLFRAYEHNCDEKLYGKKNQSCRI